MLLTPALQISISQFGLIHAGSIPQVIQELSGVSINNKNIAFIGFNGLGKDAAIAIRNRGRSNVIVCESDASLALNAHLYGFQVKTYEAVLGESDIILLCSYQKVKVSHMEKMKDGAIIASLDQDPHIEMEMVYTMKNVQIQQIGPGCHKLTFQRGHSIFILCEGNPISLACSCKQPGQIASIMLCSHLLGLISLWQNKGKLPKKVTFIQQFVLDQVMSYQIQCQNLQLMPEESFSQLFEHIPGFEGEKLTGQLRERMQTYQFLNQKAEIEKLKQQLLDKDASFKRLTAQPWHTKNLVQDLNVNVNIGNDYINQVESSLKSYKELLESLKNIKVEKLDLWSLFESLREVLKNQYQSIRDLGTTTELNESKRILRSLQEQTSQIQSTDNPQIHLEAIKQYIDVINKVCLIQNRSQAVLRDLQYKVLQNLPEPKEKWQSSEVVIYALEEHQNRCLDLINKNRELEKQILLQLDHAKQFAAKQNSVMVRDTLKSIALKVIQYTGVHPVNELKEEELQAISEVEDVFTYIDKIIDDKVLDENIYEVLFNSYDTLKKTCTEMKILTDQIEQYKLQILQFKTKIDQLEDVISQLKNVEWSIGRIYLKPAQIKQAGIAVCSGLDSQEQVQAPNPEKQEAFSQILNKIIRGQQKNIEVVGQNCDTILQAIPPETERSTIRIPKQIEAALELNRYNRKVIENLKVEGQQTLCMLTKQPNFDHNLFELENDKKKEIEVLVTQKQEQISQLQKSLEDKEKESQQYLQEITRINEEYQVYLHEKNTWRQKIQERDERITKLKEEKENFKKQMQEQKEDFKKQKENLLKEVSKLLNQIKATSVPLEADSQVQQAILERLQQVSDKENVSEQIFAGLAGGTDGLKILLQKEKLMIEESQKTLKMIISKEVDQDLRLFGLESSKQNEIRNLLYKYKTLISQHEALKAEYEEYKRSAMDAAQRNQRLELENKSLMEEIYQLKAKSQEPNIQIEDMKKILQEQQEKNYAQQEKIRLLEQQNEEVKKILEGLRNQIKIQGDKYQELLEEYNKLLEVSADKQKIALLQMKIEEKEQKIVSQSKQLEEVYLNFRKYKIEMETKLCSEMEIQRREKEIEKLQKKSSALEKKIEQMDREKALVTAELEEWKQENKRLRKQIFDMELMLRTTETRTLKETVYSLQNELKTKNEYLERLKREQEQQKNSESSTLSLECVNGALLKEIEFLRPQANRYVMLLHEVQDLKEEIARLQSVISQGETYNNFKYLEDLQDQLAKYQERNRILSKENAQYEQEAEKQKIKLRKIENQLNKYQMQIADLLKTSGQGGDAKQQQIVVEMRNDAEMYKNERSETLQRIKDMENDFKKLKQERDFLLLKIKELELQIIECSNELETFKNERTKVLTKNMEFEKQNKEKIAELEKYKQQNEKLQSECNDKNSTILKQSQKIKQAQIQLATLQKQYQDLTQELENQKKQVLTQQTEEKSDNLQNSQEVQQENQTNQESVSNSKQEEEKSAQISEKIKGTQEQK